MTETTRVVARIVRRYEMGILTETEAVADLIERAGYSEAEAVAEMAG